MVSTRSKTRGDVSPTRPVASPADGASSSRSPPSPLPAVTQHGEEATRKRKLSFEAPRAAKPFQTREVGHSPAPHLSTDTDTEGMTSRSTPASDMDAAAPMAKVPVSASTSAQSSAPSSRPDTPVSSTAPHGAVSIISHSITSLSPSPHAVSDESDNPPKKRKYKIDRENIKINKRIMSKDTEEVVRMFKKFDEEVLTNPDAKSRLLSLGFETRKRYITTFKHFIRFCCSKHLDNFFVTGDLMKEFYQQQFERSTSDKPVIRLRKMDPAFSKLQEINFLVYGLDNKDIPNRQVALDYLVYKETGKLPGAKRKHDRDSDKLAGAEADTEIDGAVMPTPAQTVPPTPKSEYSARAELADPAKKDELVSFLKSSYYNHKEDLNNAVSHTMTKVRSMTSDPQVMEVLSSLMGEINGSCQRFYYDICNGPTPAAATAAAADSGAPTAAPADPNFPIYDINHDIYTIYEILEEWYTKEPSISTRVEKWGTKWIRDEIDHETYLERASIVKFVDRLCAECNEPDKFVMANDCDRYIRDKSILDEFITEIELDVETLFKRVMRYRKRHRRN